MKRAVRSARYMVLFALLLSWLPFAEAALPARPVHIDATGFSTLPVNTQFQFASHITHLIQPNLTSELLVQSIGNEVKRPNTELSLQAAGLVTLTALNEPTVIGAQVLRDLKGMKTVFYPNPGEAAKHALSEAIGHLATNPITHINTARAITELDLNLPQSLDTLYDGLRSLEAVSANVEMASYHILVHPGETADRLIRDRLGWEIWVTAQPRHGQANAAVLSILARELGLPVERLRIVSGATTTEKTVIVLAASPD